MIIIKLLISIILNHTMIKMMLNNWWKFNKILFQQHIKNIINNTNQFYKFPLGFIIPFINMIHFIFLIIFRIFCFLFICLRFLRTHLIKFLNSSLFLEKKHPSFLPNIMSQLEITNNLYTGNKAFTNVYFKSCSSIVILLVVCFHIFIKLDKYWLGNYLNLWKSLNWIFLAILYLYFKN